MLQILTWKPEANEAFKTARKALSQAALLIYRSSRAEVAIAIDASENTIGAALQYSLKYRLKLKLYNGFWCDIHRGIHRPFILKSLRGTIFHEVPDLAHSSLRATTSKVTKRFVKPGTNKQVTAMGRDCFACQKAKIFRHNKAPVHTIPSPDSKFDAVNLDIVVREKSSV